MTRRKRDNGKEVDSTRLVFKSARKEDAATSQGQEWKALTLVDSINQGEERSICTLGSKEKLQQRLCRPFHSRSTQVQIRVPFRDPWCSPTAVPVDRPDGSSQTASHSIASHSITFVAPGRVTFEVRRSKGDDSPDGASSPPLCQRQSAGREGKVRLRSTLGRSCLALRFVEFRHLIAVRLPSGCIGTT